MKTARDVCVCCANSIKKNAHVSSRDWSRIDRLLDEGRCMYVTDFRGQGVFYYDDDEDKFGQEEPGYVPVCCPYTTELSVCQT